MALKSSFFVCARRRRAGVEQARDRRRLTRAVGAFVSRVCTLALRGWRDAVARWAHERRALRRAAQRFRRGCVCRALRGWETA